MTKTNYETRQEMVRRRHERVDAANLGLTSTRIVNQPVLASRCGSDNQRPFALYALTRQGLILHRLGRFGSLESARKAALTWEAGQ
jgi:hypothetical protein